MKKILKSHPKVCMLEPIGKQLQVVKSINQEDLTLYHFVCHGNFCADSFNNSTIELTDDVLRPSDIHPSWGYRPRPLIFMNACDGSRSEFFLTGLGGWANKFVKAGVGAFIGANWEVSDHLACKFAQVFYYNYLSENKSIAEAFRLARKAICDEEPYNSSWLAYTLYADPESKIKDS